MPRTAMFGFDPACRARHVSSCRNCKGCGLHNLLADQYNGLGPSLLRGDAERWFRALDVGENLPGLSTTDNF